MLNVFFQIKILNKIKETNLEKYGFEYPAQNSDILLKIQKSSFAIKQFKDTDLWYQASYELDFLNRYYDIFKDDITRGSSIKYEYNNKIKIYHPDFFIISLNLIIEIKNNYLLKRDFEEIKLKSESVINNGFNFIMIVDKKYDEFELLIKNFM